MSKNFKPVTFDQLGLDDSELETFAKGSRHLFGEKDASSNDAKSTDSIKPVKAPSPRTFNALKHVQLKPVRKRRNSRLDKVQAKNRRS